MNLVLNIHSRSVSCLRAKPIFRLLNSAGGLTEKDLNFCCHIDRNGRYKLIDMNMQVQNMLEKAYSAFNSRDIDTIFSTFHPDVQWPKAFEGGYVSGHDEIRKYWTRQWSEINPNVEPVGFDERHDGTWEVTVHQIVKDLQGGLIFDGIVKHIYTLQNDLLRRMEIEPV